MAANASSEQKEILSPLRGYEQQDVVSLKKAVQPLLAMVPELGQMVEIVAQKATDSADDLSSNESASVMLFALRWTTKQSSFRSILNKVLRTQMRSEILPWFPYLRLFVGALFKLPPMLGHTVYRGLKGNVTADYRKGERVVWWGLASCKPTVELAMASMNDSEARTVFVIECNMARDISNFSDDDIDMVLYPARQFEVASSVSFDNQLHLIQLKEIQITPPLIRIPPIPAETNSTASSPNNGHSKPPLELLIDRCAQQSKIDLIKQNITDAHVPLIVKQAIEAKQCNVLLLSHNGLSAKGASTIAVALEKNKTLQTLILSHNPLGDDGVISLAKTISKDTCALTTLSLHATAITDGSVKHICAMLERNKILTWLNLGGNKISDEGVELLADVLIKHNETLVALDLSKNKSITDASITPLTEVFKHNASLNTLWITRCSLTPFGEKKLEQIGKLHRHLFVLAVQMGTVSSKSV